MLLLSRPHYRHLRIWGMIRVIECLSAPALWHRALWLSLGFAVLVLAAASRALSAPALAAQQPGPAAPQASQAKPPAPDAAQAGPAAPQASQAKPPAPDAAQAGPAAPQPQPGPPPPAPLQTPPASQTTRAEQAPPAKPPAISGGAGVGFRLENADLLQFINLVAGELKLNYIVDSAVRGSVTISTSGELKPEDLLPILETVLKMNGATAIKTGNFYRFVPLAAAPKIPLAISTETSEAGLPNDDRMIMQIIPLKFVFAADMAKMLTPFLSEGGTVIVLDAGNTLILVDDSLNVKRLLEIVQQFDNTTFAAQHVRLLPVRNNVASALIPELEAIFSTYALSDKQTPLRFLPLDRINGILVAVADPVAFNEVEQWIEKLDQPAPTNGIQTFVYKVQNSEADRLVKLLNALRGASEETAVGTSGRGRGAGRVGGGPASLQEQAFPQGSSEGAAGGPFSSAGGQGTATAPAEPALRIITDPVSNSIIVKGTAQEYADIAKTLDKLDIVPRQVMIEARVYEVDLTGAFTLGLEYELQQRA